MRICKRVSFYPLVCLSVRINVFVFVIRLPTMCLFPMFILPQLVLVPSGTGSDLDVPVELIIGTTPLRKTDSSGQPSLTVRAAATRRWSATHLTADEGDREMEGS